MKLKTLLGPPMAKILQPIRKFLQKASRQPPCTKANWVEKLPQICGYLRLCKGIVFGLAIGNWEVSDATVAADRNYAPTALATCGKSLMRYIGVAYNRFAKLSPSKLSVLSTSGPCFQSSYSGLLASLAYVR